MACRQWALHAAGITTKKAATDTMVTGAAVGNRVRAAAGAPSARPAGNPRSAPPPARASAPRGTAVAGGLRRRQRQFGAARYDVGYMQDVCQGQPDPRVAWLGAVLHPAGDEHAASSATAPAMTTPPPDRAAAARDDRSRRRFRRARGEPPPPPPPPGRS